MSGDRLQLPNVGKLVAVASGKGGVGKSTIAVNLAIALAQQGLRVGLLDADVHGPNVPLMLGIRRTKDASGWDAMVPIGQALSAATQRKMPALERHGIKVMSIGLLLGEDQAALVDNVEVAGLLVRNLLTSVGWGNLDILLLDLPPGTSEPQATLLKTVALDGAIMVVTPQDLSRLDSTRALGAFQDAGVPVLGVVENMSYLICPHCGERIEVFHRSTVERRVTGDTVRMLGEIPLDPLVSEAGDTGRPVLLTAPEGPQSRAFVMLGQQVVATLGFVD